MNLFHLGPGIDISLDRKIIIGNIGVVSPALEGSDRIIPVRPGPVRKAYKAFARIDDAPGIACDTPSVLLVERVVGFGTRFIQAAGIDEGIADAALDGNALQNDDRNPASRRQQQIQRLKRLQK